MEESGWKMVAGDVFRPPRSVTLLCVQVGSGIQITASFFITLFFAALGAPGSCSCGLALRPPTMLPILGWFCAVRRLAVVL